MFCFPGVGGRSFVKDEAAQLGARRAGYRVVPLDREREKWCTFCRDAVSVRPSRSSQLIRRPVGECCQNATHKRDGDTGVSVAQMVNCVFDRLPLESELGG
jgi:hypothetical protein